MTTTTAASPTRITPTDDLTASALDAAARALGDGGPVQMVNLLRYRPEARYDGEGTSVAISGRDAYMRYRDGFQQTVARLGVEGIRVVWIGSVQSALVGGEGEAWDDIAILEYPDLATFRTVVEDPAYLADVAPHRRAGLAAWRLLATLPAGG